jgi:hypothetical protein
VTLKSQNASLAENQWQDHINAGQLLVIVMTKDATTGKRL